MRPTVALESSVFAQGLKPPANREAHTRMCAAVRAHGAEPAVTAVVNGRAVMDLAGADLERFLTRGARKVSARDLGHAIASGADGSTTVAGTLAICASQGVEVFATGGIGGVHREADGRHSYDESADLLELSRTRVITVCAGAKAILNLPATLERLETLGVTVLGFGTDEFPGFFTAHTGLRVTRAASEDEIARAFLAAVALDRPGGILVVQPPPAADAMDEQVVSKAVHTALNDARNAGVTGAAVTPFLLAAVEQATGGQSVRTNLALLEANAGLAARIAVALAAARRGGCGGPLLRFTYSD
jgi:pseudouridine-5'-phosphate glycosidase